MRELLAWAGRRYRFVVLDAPPAVIVSDPCVIAPLVDGVVLVVRAERTPRRAAARAKELIEAAGGRIVGAVFNDVPRRPWAGGYYGYGYGYGYGRYYGRGTS
jgi:Mrp family chromosome partitioning ATPase